MSAAARPSPEVRGALWLLAGAVCAVVAGPADVWWLLLLGYVGVAASGQWWGGWLAARGWSAPAGTGPGAEPAAAPPRRLADRARSEAVIPIGSTLAGLLAGFEVGLHTDALALQLLACFGAAVALSGLLHLLLGAVTAAEGRWLWPASDRMRHRIRERGVRGQAEAWATRMRAGHPEAGPLDFSMGSLAALDRILGGYGGGDADGAGDGTQRLSRRDESGAAAYLGECLRRRAGGRYERGDAGTGPVVLVNGGDGWRVEVALHERVRARVTNGEVGGIQLFAEGYVRAVAQRRNAMLA